VVVRTFVAEGAWDGAGAKSIATYATGSGGINQNVLIAGEELARGIMQ